MFDNPTDELKRFLFSTIFWGSLYIYIGYSQMTSEFCAVDVTFSKINNVIVQNPAILDPDSLLGESGSIIQWFRILGITQVVMAGVSLMSTACSEVSCQFIMLVVQLLFQCGMGIYGIVLFFAGTIPSQCINFEMGNNVAYSALAFLSILNIALYSFIAFFCVIWAIMECLRNISPKMSQNDPQQLPTAYPQDFPRIPGV